MTALECSGEADALAFASGYQSAVFAERGLQPVRKRFEDVAQSGCVNNFGEIAFVWRAVAKVRLQ